MSEIKVETKAQDDGWEFQVTVIEGRRQTSHRVTMSKATYDQLTGGTVSPEECVKQSFEFLLQREPKESILRQFDLTKISYYFPDFEQAFQQRLKPK
jgi:hypothetical protein